MISKIILIVKRFRIFLSLLIIIYFFSSVFSSPIFAASSVIINEFAAVTAGTTIDPDWVELYNFTENQVDLSGWLIRDSTETNKIQLSGIICPKSFRKFDFSNKLNNDGDTIRLIDSTNNLLDTIIYFSADIPQHIQGQSTSRSPDGSATWVVFSQPSPMNVECQTISTPTLTPTPIPTPTFTPTPTPSSTKATYKINEVKDEDGNILSSVQIYIDKTYIHHFTPETITFCDGCSCDGYVSCGFGSHVITLQKTGYNNWAETKTLNWGDAYEVNPIMQVSSSTVSSTSTPTSASTPTPTPRPSASPTVLPSASASAKIIPTGLSLVLGESSQAATPSIVVSTKPKIQAVKSSSPSNSLAPIFFILGALTVLGAGLSTFWLKRKKGIMTG